jgi:hypothetical protein
VFEASVASDFLEDYPSLSIKTLKWRIQCFFFRSRRG